MCPKRHKTFIMTPEIQTKVSVPGSSKVILVCLLLGMIWLVPCHAQIADALLKQLAAEEFKTRQAAEEELTLWAFDNPGIAYDVLYRHSRDHADAEVRVRCLSILRRLFGDIYDSQGEGYMGIRMLDEAMRLPGQGELEVAVLLVADVMKDSPAEKGGLLAGDAIVSLEKAGWKGLPASDDFRNRIKAIPPRSLVTLQVLREGKIIDIQIRLARRPAAVENPFEMPDQERINAMEEVRREEHFKKWLLDRANGR
jgi:hypothetical protein